MLLFFQQVAPVIKGRLQLHNIVLDFKSMFGLFRAPWRGVCGGSAGRDAHPARHALPSHRHRELCAAGPQEDCRMVGGFLPSLWRRSWSELFPGSGCFPRSWSELYPESDSWLYRKLSLNNFYVKILIFFVACVEDRNIFFTPSGSCFIIS